MTLMGLCHAIFNNYHPRLDAASAIHSSRTFILAAVRLQNGLPEHASNCMFWVLGDLSHGSLGTASKPWYQHGDK